MAYKRAQFEELMQRMDEPRAFIQLVTGPRQVGKSTLVGQVLDELKKPHLLYSAQTYFSNSEGATYIMTSLVASARWLAHRFKIDAFQ